MSRILSGGRARAAMLRGIERMTRLLRPTLGPVPRVVAVQRVDGGGPPEVLDSAATIARRTIQLSGPFEDMGAMMIRHLAWRVGDEVGDGAATAVVLAHSLVQAGARYVAAGGNPVLIRRGMQRGLEVAVGELHRQARTIERPEQIASLVAGTLRGSDLARMVGEVVDAVGPDGSVDVQIAHGTETVVEYLEGVRWNEGYVSPMLLGRDESATLSMLEPRVLVTDYPLERAEQLLPALEACIGAGARNVVIVAPEIGDSAVGLLTVNRARGVLEGAIAVRAPASGSSQQTRILEDIAVITGGRCVRRDASDRLADVRIDDLGQARQAWASRLAFGITGGRGSAAAMRQRIAEARAELSALEDDAATREWVRERISRLAGVAAVIHVGAPIRGQQEDLKMRIEAAVRSARLALAEGVVPGGGAALLACTSRLDALHADGDEAFGVKALAQALAEPMRVILANAGLDAAPIMSAAREGGLPPSQAAVFDAVRREWVDPWSTGLVDPLAVTLAALRASVSAAAVALTAEVLVRRKQPPVARDP